MTSPSTSSTSSTLVPSWPPSLTSHQLSSLSSSSTDYALSHGLIYRPPVSSTSTSTTPSTSSVIHAPFSLLPSPFPRDLFNNANHLQPAFNYLYSKIALDDKFLERVVGGSVVKVDDFQKGLWDVWNRVRKDGISQPLHLGLFRSDYLLHQEEGSKQLEIKQVEFNTISSSFGPLCARVSQLHKYLQATTSFFNSSQHLGADSLPDNPSLQVLTSGLAEGHEAYLESLKSLPKESLDEVDGKIQKVILFVVQEGERNAFDQRGLEYELLERYGILIRRATFSELSTQATLTKSKRLILQSSSTSIPSVEISVVYFRAGYGPSDYPTSLEWDTRYKLESSLSIKCPTIALQLSGSKKVQQELSIPDILEYFLKDTEYENSIEDMRKSFSDLYPLDQSEIGIKGYQLAMNQPENYVMKPQREGGGNNIYRLDILKSLEEMKLRDERKGIKDGDGEDQVKEMEGYILMSLINPPKGVGNYLIKAGAGVGDGSGEKVQGKDGDEKEVKVKGPALVEDVVSELGIYGTSLFGKGQDGKIQVRKSNAGGYLLRTKGRSSDEGGVAVGFSVIDSPVLV